jgi:methylated-DNA-[protein]-cysteine S-methyltransferase
MNKQERGSQAAIVFSTPWGWMAVSETRKGIDCIVLPQTSRKTALSHLNGLAKPVSRSSPSAHLGAARQQLLDYLSGTRDRFDLPLDLSRGTLFQRQVWRTLQRVPYGKLRSYQWVAFRVGGRRYARAVGNAVGANPLPIVVPCHRIIAQDASIGGFSGGLPTKRKLLTLEGTVRYVKSRKSPGPRG